MVKRHMKRCSTLLVTRECKSRLQWDITWHQSERPSSKYAQRTKCWRRCGEKGTFLYSAGGNVNWHSRYGEQYGGSWKRATTWPWNLSPGHKSKGKMAWKDSCTPVFIAALFTRVKTWKQSKFPSTYEWIKKCGTYIQRTIAQPLKRMK